jgi:hypothetical protein
LFYFFILSFHAFSKYIIPFRNLRFFRSRKFFNRFLERGMAATIQQRRHIYADGAYSGERGARTHERADAI